MIGMVQMMNDMMHDDEEVVHGLALWLLWSNLHFIDEFLE